MSTRGYGGAHYGLDDYYGGAERVTFAGRVDIVFGATARILVPFRGTALIQFSAEGELFTSIGLAASVGMSLSTSGALQTAIWFQALAPITWQAQGALFAPVPVSNLGLLSEPESSAMVGFDQDWTAVGEPDDRIEHDVWCAVPITLVLGPVPEDRNELRAPNISRRLRGPSPRRLESN